MSSSSKIIQNLKQRTIKYQKTRPVVSSTELIKQKKAKAIYSYTSNIQSLKVSAGTTDESAIFNRVDSRCGGQDNGNETIGLANLSNRNNNNVVGIAKSRVTPVVVAGSSNSLTDIHNVNLNSRVGATLCCNNNEANITTFTEPCQELEYLTRMNLPQDQLPQRKETCCPKVYTRSQLPERDTSCCGDN
jgi:hypothetical protein